MMDFATFQALLEWLLPPGLNILMILFGILIWFFSKSFGRCFILIGFVSLWLFSMPIVAYNLVDLLQNQYAMLTDKDFSNSKSQAILVLGGGEVVKREYENKQSVSDPTLHRIEYAAYLNQKTNLPIIVSGGSSYPGGVSVAELMAGILQDKYHLPVLFQETKSLTTADESRYLDALLKEHHIETVYLVTNAWHMPRSVYAFNRQGIRVIPAPMGYFTYGPGYSYISFIPNANALLASSIVMHEVIGGWWYRWSYRN